MTGECPSREAAATDTLHRTMALQDYTVHDPTLLSTSV
jgi:hypothetical protein